MRKAVKDSGNKTEQQQESNFGDQKRTGVEQRALTVEDVWLIVFAAADFTMCQGDLMYRQQKVTFNHLQLKKFFFFFSILDSTKPSFIHSFIPP